MDLWRAMIDRKMRRAIYVRHRRAGKDLEALNIIASKCKISIDDLLKLEKRDVIQKLNIKSYVDAYKNLRCYPISKYY